MDLLATVIRREVAFHESAYVRSSALHACLAALPGVAAAGDDALVSAAVEWAFSVSGDPDSGVRALAAAVLASLQRVVDIES